ncbi:hypothetical protein EUX98_g2255 [Antrodiella citrinella]|uniref:VHS domain-containing protein n=1 Tax=Antrodiella citrinella TaxID=2447956 RepID=A0A4V3XJ77_9APHY|nr:hypothetical protein EUX98_g2255 [Antrodiella citrinella]
MKRLFGREKPKIVKTPSAASELGSEDAQYFDGQHYQQPLQPYDRMHSQDRAHGLVHSSSDEHWDMVNSHDAGHSPIPSAYIPRAASPFSGTVSVSSHKSNGDRDSNFRKKPPNTPSPAAAVGILRALDPHHSQAATTPSPREYDRETLDDSVQPKSMEKKERKGFWERTKDRDKEKERPKEEERKERLGNVLRPREKEKEKEKKDGELTRMIGYLTATSSEDWSLVLEVCERASANEAAARETVKALRDEFKYADPTAKLAAARLWAVLLQNASGIFMTQSTSRKFLDTLEDVIQSPRTSPVVKERLLQVLAAAAYAGSARHNHLEKDPFRALWRKVKAPNQPDEGIPLDPEDAMLNPPVTAVTPLPETPRTATQKPPNKHKPSSRIIPPEEDIRRLFEECKYAHGNASLLSDALVHARPEDLQGKAIIKVRSLDCNSEIGVLICDQEFYARCRASQELIYAQIPWASANAERSRGAAAATPRRHRASPPDSPQAESEETVEEQLLGELLSANEQLTEALKVYEDLERIKTEREVEERSRKDTRMKYKDRVSTTPQQYF